MSHPLNLGLVRVLDTSERIIGAGFLIGGDIVITCDHVVTAALGSSSLSGSEVGNKVVVDFPGLREQPKVPCEVIYRGGTESTRDDIAVLKLERPKPDDAVALPIVNLPSPAGEKFKAEGFPANHDSGLWVGGECGDEHTGGLVQLSVGNIPVKEGMSGSPLWCERHGGVIALLVTRILESDAGAFAIPVPRIVDAYPGISLKEPIAQKPFSHDLSVNLTPTRRQVVISETPAGFEWKGDISPSDIAQVWANHSKIDIAYVPQLHRSSELAEVLLRIALHGAGGTLSVNDPNAWIQKSLSLVEGCLGVPWDKSSPTPAAAAADKWSIANYADLRPRQSPYPIIQVTTGAALADSLQEQLDGWVLEFLTEKVQSLLNHDLIPDMALEIEAELALEMKAVWEGWRYEMAASPEVRRHFLRVALSTAMQNQAKAGQARVGKRTVQKCLVEGVILALAVTVGIPQSWQPTHGSDFQNLAFYPNGVGHLCGLELINSVMLAQKIRGLSWRTDYVFLPHYRGPGDEIPELTRRLSDTDASVRRFDNVNSYSPLFFTNEAKFSRLLAEGKIELTAYLRDVVAKWDARQQAEIDQAAGDVNGIS